MVLAFWLIPVGGSGAVEEAATAEPVFSIEDTLKN
jgi:hypothetical protein